ncbi:MAG: START domain-containing protein [Cytophagales bacterium]|nr:START domain-containing protein [Cytophagales bacterium]
MLSIADEKWKLVKEKNGIAVYTRNSDNTKLKEFKATCILHNVDIHKLYILFEKSEYTPIWSHGVIRCDKLTPIDSATSVYRYIIDTPWPLKQRDVIQKQSIKWIELHQKFCHLASTVPDYLPVEKKYVRVKYGRVEWYFQKNTDGSIAVTYIFCTDPDAPVPNDMIAYFIIDTPIKILEKLSIFLSSKTYHDMVL